MTQKKITKRVVRKDTKKHLKPKKENKNKKKISVLKTGNQKGVIKKIQKGV